MSPQRVVDAANPHPYPFVVRQERLAPENRERNGKPKKSKPRPRADRNTRQEEEIRFNTGPRNLRGVIVNCRSRRPFRILGRYDRGYDDHTGTVFYPKFYLSTLSQLFLGIPDYPPPSFQEAMTTPLSARSSRTTLVPVSIPTVLIPENIPEVPEVPVEPSNIETLNELIVSGHGSDSDESLQIIDKSSVVCSDDLPKGVELEQRIRSDWKIRRGLDFPGSSYADSSQSLGNSMGTDRGRSSLRVPGRLTIDPDASAVEAESNMSPISPAKRRFLSLSPLRTILSPRLLTDRPMSAHPTPYSSPYAASSRNVFFRSSMNLASSSMMKLSFSPDKNDSSLTRKLFGKGKEKLDTWEVLDEDNYPDEFEAEGRCQSSLMSEVQSVESSTSFIVGDSPTRSQSFAVGIRPSARINQFPNGSQNDTMQEEQSFEVRQRASLRAGTLLDRQICGSPASASTSAVSSMAISLDSPPLRSISPVIQPRAESPAPSVLQNTTSPIHPFRPLTVTTGNQVSSSKIYQHALDTPLPATPTPSRFASISARSFPNPLNDSISAKEAGTTPSTTNCLSEPMTPNRHHYSGRPLPRPPPSVTRSDIDPTFAPEVVYDAGIEGRSSACCPEGLLIDLNDTSRYPERPLIDLDDTSLYASGASSLLSDGAHFRSQLHLTMTPPSAAGELTESRSLRSALSDYTIRTSPITSDDNRPFELTELDLLASRIGDEGSDHEVNSNHLQWTPSFNPSSELIGPASSTNGRIVSPHQLLPHKSTPTFLSLGKSSVTC